MLIKPLVKLFFVLLIGSLPASAQSGGEKSVEVYSDAGFAGRMSLEPFSAASLFPNSKVYLSERKIGVSLLTGDAALLQKMQFVTVRAYSLEEASKADSSGKKQTTQASSARMNAVTSNRTIYILSELFCDENIPVFNELLRSLALRVESPEEALLVAKFFLQLGYYRFSDPDNFVVSTLSDLSPKQFEFPGQDMTEIQHAIRPPASIEEGDTYRIEIVAQDRDAGFVLLRHWSIRILRSQISDVKEEVLVPTWMHYRAGETPSTSMSGTLASPVSTLRFQLARIADGMTPDSKDLNFSSYSFNTCDGSQVVRSASYFESPHRAVKELDSYLHHAVQILERGKWTGEHGAALGERVLVLDSVGEPDGLRASILLRRDTRLFEVSSSCLRNALEFEKVWFGSDPSQLSSGQH
jgi:hypothetical protein